MAVRLSPQDLDRIQSEAEEADPGGIAGGYATEALKSTFPRRQVVIHNNKHSWHGPQPTLDVIDGRHEHR